MKRLSAFAPFLLCLLIPSPATSDPLAKQVEVNGVPLPYVEQGTGEAIVFVHGAVSDLRAWEPVRERIAKKHKFIAYTQRYFGTGRWHDEGQNFSVATHADDLVKFIASLDAGPVHLVGWSYGGLVATAAALRNPSLVRSLTLYEAGLLSVLPPESPEGQAAREDRAKTFAAYLAAAKAGDAVHAAKLLIEAVSQLPPGGFEREPQALQTMVLDNARTVPLRSAAPPPAIICDKLKAFTRPTLVMRGEKTQAFYALIAEAIGKCVPGAQSVVLRNLNHVGPERDPEAFADALLAFLSKHASGRDAAAR